MPITRHNPLSDAIYNYRALSVDKVGMQYSYMLIIIVVKTSTGCSDMYSGCGLININFTLE